MFGKGWFAKISTHEMWFFWPRENFFIANIVKAAVSSLRQFLVTETFWKFMKNGFYFILKALFVLKRFGFSSWHFGYVEETARLERKG